MTADSSSPDSRLAALQQWLLPLSDRFRLEPASLAPASSDASFRRYFRIPAVHAGQSSLIVMDAPPPQEDCRPFVAVAERFASAGLNVPKVLAADLEQGFLLLSDLGSTTYLSALNDQSADRLYGDASSALIRLQQASPAAGLPDYDRALLARELELFPTWYVTTHCGHTLEPGERAALDRMFEALLVNNLAQPMVDVHRDYHSRNLMLTTTDNPGVLDFQDAVRGPITYDLVSLLRDAYVHWDEERILDWAIRHWEKARRAHLPVSADFGEFWRDFEWMGLQRHIKVLGIFARLYHRDGKSNYLNDLPLVLHYTRRAAERYITFKPLLRLLDKLEQRTPQTGYTF
jgi:aminoglycoside/choline kinase family phosphotransferase